MNSVEYLNDLMVMHSSDGSCTVHCHMVVKKAAKMVGAIRYIFC